MPEQELLVRIVGDDRSLQQAFTRSSRGAQQFESRTAKLGAGLTRGFAAAGIAIGAQVAIQTTKQLVDAASDLNEEITKSQQVFGESAADIRAWSEGTASAIGVSQRAALAATGIFGNLFTAVGIGEADAAATSKQLVELGADLASFNNANIDDVFLALRSGLVGEAEPLRKFGILLSEARVQQVALTNTGKSAVTQLTNQEKAQARIQIIMQDSAKAQGDFARTSGGLANQQRIAAAEAENLAANLGSVLAPAEQIALAATIALTGGINDLIDGMKGLRGSLRDSHFADGFNSAIEDANSHISDFFINLRDGIPFLSGFKAAVQNAFDQTPFDTTVTGTRDESVTGSPGAVAASNARVAADQAEAARRAAQRALEASRRRFAAFTKGLGLKLKNAGLTASLNDDLDVLQEIERAILRQIAREGRTFKLANDLADIRIQIANKRDEIDQRASDAEDAAQERIDNRRERARARREARAAAHAGDQFEALGLTREGDQRVPGIGALRRRATSLLEQIQGTDLNTARNRNRIGAVLSAQFKDAGREVRQAILSMFNEISAALEQGSKSTQRQQTKFRVANTTEILSGLGLSEDEQQRLRRRLSRLGPGGTIPQDGGAGGAFGLAVGGGNTIVTGPVTVVSNDPDDMGKKIEKKTRRTTLTRTGNQAGRHK